MQFFFNFFQKISAFQEKRCHRNQLSHWTLVEPFFKQAHQQCWNIQAQNWRSKMFKEGQRIKNIIFFLGRRPWIFLNCFELPEKRKTLQFWWGEVDENKRRRLREGARGQKYWIYSFIHIFITVEGPTQWSLLGLC